MEHTEQQMAIASRRLEQTRVRLRRPTRRLFSHDDELETSATMPNRREEEEDLLPGLNSRLDSPHHNETIKSSAKISDMKTISRSGRMSTNEHRFDASAHQWQKQKHLDRQQATSSPFTSTQTIRSNERHPTARLCTTMSTTSRDSEKLAQTQTQTGPHRDHRLPLFTNVSRLVLVSLLLASLVLVPTSQASATQQEQSGPASEAKAEALVSAKQPQNVITIKYANASKSSTGEDESNSRQLSVFQLHDEPLSVSVIQSRFSQSLQLFDVSQNQLPTLPKDLFCPLSNEVRSLNISHNLLENFDCLGLISKDGQLCLIELRVLDMSHNRIKHLPDTGVATLHNLEVLNLSHNLIETLDEISLSSLFKLARLDLSHNRIRQLPTRIFHKSSSMQVLRLQANHLQNNINQLFLSGLVALEELNLASNNISHVSEFAFLDKPNLTRVDLSHNSLTGLRQDALRVSSPSGRSANQLSSPPPSFKPRLHHNGEFAGLAQVNLRQAARPASVQTSTEFYLSSNPFICNCYLEWMRKFQPAARRSSVLSQSGRFADSPASAYENSYQSDQPAASASVIQQQQASQQQQGASSSSAPSNTISENQPQASSNQQQTLASSSQQATSSGQVQYGRIADLDLIKCSPEFRRNSHSSKQQHQHHAMRSHQQHSRSGAPSGGEHHLAVQVHHANNHLHHQQSSSSKSFEQLHSNSMIDLMTADPSNFLCHYKSHCFALCHCCEFDACDCEMICPAGCNCYYDLKWATNIIDCSSNNHTVVPDRIPMDVSGLYLDGNNIDSLKPSNLIARKSLKVLYLNSSNLQYIANRTFNGLIELQTLYLNDNMLKTLYGYEFEPLAQLRALYLQSNRLDHINNATFIYLRSLEILDLSNNRLTSMNLDLFMFIGHHNIRLRQLSLAHNWWSCQCQSVQSFRQILKQKFLLNGGPSTGVSIVDRHQLRCYYNSTTVGPLILEGPTSSYLGALPASSSSSGPSSSANRQQQQLTEINQCSDMLEDANGPYDTDLNPPIIHPAAQPAPISNGGDPQTASTSNQQQSSMPSNDSPWGDQQQQAPPAQGLPPNEFGEFPAYPQQIPPALPPSMGEFVPRGQAPGSSAPSVPMTSYMVASILSLCILVVAISVFVFVRQQQQRYHSHHHHPHHKKSSAASTTSVSSSASSTAISGPNTQRHLGHHPHVAAGTNKFNQHHLHLPVQPAHFGQTLSHQQHHHLLMGGQAQQQQQASNLARAQHHHSASSQSNIYAALVPSTTNGNSSTIVTNIQQQLYSNSSTTASHNSSSANSSQQNRAQQAAWHQQALYGAGPHQQSLYAAGPENYAHAAPSMGSYKTSGLYQPGQVVPPLAGGCDEVQMGGRGVGDWISLPKVKHFMAKLINKSLASLGSYRASGSRDELSNITSDKIYDAFLSYDKRDEPFVMQYLSAELEYGSPQFRVADRYRDLPLPSSAYIAEAITSVIGCSHRTIVVLTENYLQSEWCRFELEAAMRESALDKTHKIIAVVLEPKCLQEMDAEMRNLLLAATGNQPGQLSCGQSVYAAGSPAAAQSQQLVQLADGNNSPPVSSVDFFGQQLVTTLANPTAGSHQQVCTQTAGSRLTFINFNERKFWPKLKQLMPMARPSSQSLTLTTKN